jgi:Tfp pilus assembly protein PilZ
MSDGNKFIPTLRLSNYNLWIFLQPKRSNSHKKDMSELRKQYISELGGLFINEDNVSEFMDRVKLLLEIAKTSPENLPT